MKRTNKFLAVVLSAVLLCGAFAVFSSADEAAEITGITVTREQNYNGLSPDWGGSASAGNPTGDAYAWTMVDRVGEVTINTGDDGNQYMVFTQSDYLKASGPYFGTGYGGSGTTARPTYTDGVLIAKGDVANYPYLVFDFDFMSPTGEFSNTAIQLELRTFMDGDTTLDVARIPAIDSLFRFNSDADGCYIYINSDPAGTKTYVNPYEFTHATIIYEAVCTETYRTLNAHVYIDGKLWHTAIGEIPDYEYAEDTPHLTYDEIRVNFPAANKPTQSIGFDNVVTRLIDTTYNGNLKEVLASGEGDLSAWESNLYKEENMPLGLTVATANGQSFDSLQKAVDAVPAGSTITVLNDATYKVIIGKELTINAGEYTVNLAGAENFGVREDDGVYTVSSTLGQQVAVYWDECYCDVPCEDMSIKHPLNHYEPKVDLYAKFYDIYNPTYVDFMGGGEFLYRLVGWQTADGVAIDKNSAVTMQDVSNRYVELFPVYEKFLPTFEYIKGGETVFSDGSVTLNSIFAAADANTTVKLLADYKNSEKVTVGKTLTFDLNGYTYDATVSGAKYNAGIISVSSPFTFTSSVPGGKAFSGATNSGGDPLFAGSGQINIIGRDENGNNTLSIMAPTLVQAWSNHAKLYIDGGEYYRTRSDNGGFIQLQNTFNFEIKNALIYDPSGSMFFLPGRYAAASDDITAFGTVDNCILIASSNVCPNSFKEMSVTFTNCYIDGNLTASTEYSGETAGFVTLGEGNYFNATITENVVLADGVAVYDIPNTLTANMAYNSYTVGGTGFDDSSFVLNEHKKDVSTAKFTASASAEPIDVKWMAADGVTLLGISQAFPGTKATAPTDLDGEAVVEGWIKAVPDEWIGDLRIPADATEFTVVAKEGGAIKYLEDLQMLFAIAMQTHFEYQLYLPSFAEDSGIKVTNVTLSSERTTNFNDNIARKVVISGKEYSYTNVWPGAVTAASDTPVSVTFTYNGQSYTVSTSVSLPYYCEYLLGDNGYGEQSKDLAANVANYVYSVAGAVGTSNNGVTKLGEIVANNTARIFKPEASELVVPDTKALNTYISGVQLSVAGYGPTLRFTLTSAGKAASFVRLSTGHSNTTNTKELYLKAGYVETANTRIRWINSMTITIEGTEVKGTFTFANYIAMLQSTADSKSMSVLTAMYGYGKAVENYYALVNPPQA